METHWRISLLVEVLIAAWSVLHFTEDNSRPHRLNSQLREADNLSRALLFFAPDSAHVRNDLCRKHSVIYSENIRHGTPWALQMLDSSSPLPGDGTTNNTVQLGDFDACLSVKNIASDVTHQPHDVTDRSHDVGVFSGQHCLVYVSQLQEEARDRRTIRHKTFVEVNTMRNYLLSTHLREWSVCVPSSCGPNDVMAHLQSAFRKLSMRVDDVTCSIGSNDIAFAPAHWFELIAFSIIAVMLLLGATYDICNSKITNKAEGRPRLLAAFSVVNNCKELWRVSGEVSMPALNGIKVLSILAVAVVHYFVMLSSTPSTNTEYIYQLATGWRFTFLHSLQITTDSFFLISGILVCYIYMKTMETQGSVHLLEYNLFRYLRMTPVLLLWIVFTTRLGPLTGSGPHWDPTAWHELDMCQKHLWANALYINNYINTEIDMCFVTTWYLAADMQLFWLSPLLLYPLYRWPRIGKALALSLFGAGLVIAFLNSFNNELRVSHLMSKGNHSKMFFLTHVRFTPWLIGVGLGYLLHKTKQRSLHIPAALLTLGWLSTVVMMSSVVLLTHHFLQTDQEYEPMLDSVFLALMRPLWSLGLAWIVFACVKGYGGFVNRFLSCDVFQVLGKLTFAFSFIHMSLMGSSVLRLRRPLYIDDGVLITRTFVEIAKSTAAAAGLYLAFEAPINSMATYFKDSKHSLKKSHLS